MEARLGQRRLLQSEGTQMVSQAEATAELGKWLGGELQLLLDLTV